MHGSPSVGSLIDFDPSRTRPLHGGVNDPFHARTSGRDRTAFTEIDSGLFPGSRGEQEGAGGAGGSRGEEGAGGTGGSRVGGTGQLKHNII